MHGVSALCNDDCFVRLHSLGLDRLYLKLESMNPSGSIKLKAAVSMVEAAERAGRVRPDTTLIESSSGSLGVALAMVAAERGYRFTCVVDPNISPHNLRLMQAFGATVVRVIQRDENGGFLGTRIRHIQTALAADHRLLWLNQYANPENPGAHFRSTAPAIARRFPRLDYLFIGAGTTGTLMGCLRYFQQHRPEVKVVAVDSVGSVTFGHAPGKRHVPGLGTSQRPDIFDPRGLHDHVMVPEADAIRLCRQLARQEGVLVGGSTGTVLSGVLAWRERLPPDAVVVAISPDLGDRYLDTVYNDEWVSERFGPECLGLAVPTEARLPPTLPHPGAWH